MDEWVYTQYYGDLYYPVNQASVANPTAFVAKLNLRVGKP